MLHFSILLFIINLLSSEEKNASLAFQQASIKKAVIK